jgi:hypothetical protein
MISRSTAVWVVLYLIIGGLVFWLLNFLVDYVHPPEPWYKVAKVILVVLAVLVLIGILVSLVQGVPLFRP